MIDIQRNVIINAQILNLSKQYFVSLVIKMKKKTNTVKQKKIDFTNQPRHLIAYELKKGCV